MTIKTGEPALPLHAVYSTKIPSTCPDIYLSDVSAKDKPWEKHKNYAVVLSTSYQNPEFESYSKRISVCANSLAFKTTSEGKFKLWYAKFCRVRTCPVCQWRRSLVWKAKAHKLMPKVIEAYPTHRWIFLTLTVRNCPVGELKETIGKMNKAFERLSKLKAFPAIGWIKSLEVTKGADNTAHPHFHVLMLVPPSYFSGKYYLNQKEWIKLWEKSLRVNYSPSVNVKAIKDKDPRFIIPEVFKYQTKESDYFKMIVDDKGRITFAASPSTTELEWIFELTRQMKKVRAVSIGGVLKEYMADLENDINSEDLVHVDESNENLEINSLEPSKWFTWMDAVRRYKYDSNEID